MAKAAPSGQEHSARSDEDADGVPLSKNALLARENRRKRKQYVTNLEADLAAMSKENASLKGQLADKDCKVALMEREIIYLKGVLANVEEISGLIRTIKARDPYTSLSPQVPAGVCLHVQDKKLSLEFCSVCSSRALENWAEQV